MVNLDDVKNSIPEFAKDIKLNFSSLIINSEEDDELLLGCAYASALALDSQGLISVFENEARARVSDDFIQAVKSTVAIMTLNNIWYKYRDSLPNGEMKTAAQRMRVNIMRDHAGLNKTLFESISLCISAVNGCTFCVKAHSNLLLDNGKSKDYVLNIGRIASVIVATDKAIKMN